MSARREGDYYDIRSEVFNHPQITIHRAIGDREVTAIWRWARQKGRGVLPENRGITGQVYMKKGARSETSTNKQAVCVSGPVNCVEIRPTVHLNVSAGVVPQPQNGNRTRRSPQGCDAGTIRREIREPPSFVGIEIEIEPCEFSACPCLWIDSGNDSFV